MTEEELLQIIREAADDGRTRLDLSRKQLTALPSEIGQLTNLRTLFLYDNQLSSLPPEIGQLQNLDALYLHDNQLTSLPFEIRQLTKLDFLHLSRNQLSSLPNEIGQLTNLDTLLLNANQLSILPTEIGQLVKLSRLYLSNNQLTTLPPEISQLNLHTLNLRGNPLTSPPPEIVEQGVQAILSYLRELARETQQWVSKMLVVGQGGVGKTSLLRALKSEPFDPGESTTRGIEIVELHLPHPEETDVTMQLNAWDFGGQEIYHATHQFFLTNRSLFLLAWNARHGWEQGKLNYWLDILQARAPDSPVVLVATHIDQRDADLPLQDLQRQYPQIVASCAVSNKDNRGIDDLRQQLIGTAADLPLMGEKWPETWLNAANAVRAHPKRHVTPRELFALMTEHEVTEEHTGILAQWLHDLGDILYYRDEEDINDTVILKPQWVTEHMSLVL